MKLKVILFVFAGLFILVSCRKEVTGTTDVSENESTEANSEGDDPSNDAYTEAEPEGDEFSGVEVSGVNIVPESISTGPNADFDGYYINNIADAGNYLWLSTLKEVYRLEKKTGTVSHFGFDNTEMPLNYSITTIKCNETGLPWIGAEYTGTLKMREDGKWDLFPPVSTGEFEKGTHHILFAHNGVVWTSTINMLARYRGNTTDTFTTNGTITSLAEDNEGNVWIGTANYFHGHSEGLVKYDGEKWTVYDSSPTGSNALIFGSIAADKNGVLWMGGYNGIDFPYTNLVEFDGINWHVYSPGSFSGPFYINQIAIDETGKKWLATNYGLITFDGSVFNRCNDLNSRLQSTDIHAIVIDEDGKKWVGTDKGLAVFD